MKWRLYGLAVFLLILSLIAISCGTIGEPIPDDLYSKNILPGFANKYTLGSDSLPFKRAYFGEIYILGKSLYVDGVKNPWDSASGEGLTNHGNEYHTSTFAVYPSQVGQAGKFLTTNGTDTSWGVPSAGSVAWGDITGILSNQGDLQAALDGKATTSHTQAETTITGGSANQFVKWVGAAADWVTLTWQDIVGALGFVPLQSSNITYELLDTNGDVGTGAGQLAIGGHSHTGLVTNGDSHDHFGGDGAQIDYENLTNKPSIPSQYTDELAQDAVGGMIADTTTVDLTYTDNTPELKADLVTEGVEDLVGAMVDGSETGITVTYNDGTGNLDFTVSNGGAWTIKVQLADQSVTNSAVLVNATNIQFTTVANTQYTIRYNVMWNTTSASADFKYRLTHAGDTTRVRRMRTYMVAGATGSLVYPSVAIGSAFDTADQTLLASVAGDGFVQEEIILRVGASGGLLVFTFAQNTATAAQSAILYEGSYIEYAQS